MDDNLYTATEALQSERESQAKMTKSLNDEIKELSNLNAKLSTKLSDREVEIEKLHGNIATLDARLTSLSAQFAKDESQLASEMQSLQVQLRELQHAFDKQSIALASKERETARLREEKVRFVAVIGDFVRLTILFCRHL